MAGADRYASRRLASLGSYAFAEVDREVARLRERGIEPIDFGVGDPTGADPGGGAAGDRGGRRDPAQRRLPQLRRRRRVPGKR